MTGTPKAKPRKRKKPEKVVLRNTRGARTAPESDWPDGKFRKATYAKMLEAIKASRGIKSGVAQYLGVTRRTVYDWINEMPDLVNHFHEAEEILLDIAQKQVIDAVEDGNVTVAMWVLKTKGASRGYATHPLPVKVEVSNKPPPVTGIEPGASLEDAQKIYANQRKG